MPCYIRHAKDGGRYFLCGDFGQHCTDSRCMDIATKLCDYPVGEGKTCDMPLCDSHAFNVAPEVDYCPGHALMWRKFVEAGGVERDLRNVVPFAAKRPDHG